METKYHKNICAKASESEVFILCKDFPCFVKYHEEKIFTEKLKYET